MLALIDGDALIFRNGFAVEHNHYCLWECGLEQYGPIEKWEKKKDIPKGLGAEFMHEGCTLYEGKLYLTNEKEIEPLENCLYLVRQDIYGILEAVRASSYKVFIKGEGNFRNEISKTRVYKGNRDALHRPKYERDIREYLIGKWGAVVVNDMEADDAIAMEQAEDIEECLVPRGMDPNTDEILYGKFATIICAIDKDFNQVPGWHYNFSKKDKYWVSEEDALRFFYQQLLTGDPSDNIQGIPGCGPKTAEKLLKDCTTEAELYSVCFEEYKKAYPDNYEEVIVEMGRLLYLLRSPKDCWKPPV